MTASDLHGLNIVDNPDLSSPHLTDLANTSAFPDLEAQLELWTNLAFQSDEPFVPRPLSPSSNFDKAIELANLAHQQQAVVQSDFDMTRFFAGFGIDPFAVPPTAPSILSTQDIAPLDITLPQHRSQTVDAPSFPPLNIPDDPTDSQDIAPPAKRARIRKSSVSDNHTSPSVEDQSSSMTADTDDLDAETPDSPNTTTPITASEDKRRRNTAASARFRAKKKEREAALEKKSKELEGRVGELERECEALRRENGWLKGLVVGVTNAGNSVQGTKRRRGEDTQGSETDLQDGIKA